jgi:hypothetical protein
VGQYVDGANPSFGLKGDMMVDACFELLYANFTIASIDGQSFCA